MARPMTFSPSSLADFRENPRGWWIEKKHGIKRPRGIFSSMPNAIDAIIKTRLDAFRAEGEMPAELARIGKTGARLFPDVERLKKLRAWQSAPVYIDSETGARLSGALDDALVSPASGICGVALEAAATVGDVIEAATSPQPLAISSLDIKTTKLRDDLGAYSARYYLLGQSCYHLMLDAELAAGGFKGYGIAAVGDEATLAYFMPKAAKGASADGVAMEWATEVVTLPVDRAMAVDVLRAAVACLAGPMPLPGANGDWDSWAKAYADKVRYESKAADAKKVVAA